MRVSATPARASRTTSCHVLPGCRAQVEQAQKALSEKWSGALDTASAATRAAKDFAEKEETKAAFEAARDVTVASFKATKEVRTRPNPGIPFASHFVLATDAIA